jgi:hypothetical protein
VSEQSGATGPVATATVEDLTDALDLVVDKGLSISNVEVAPLLIQLRSVYARAVIPSDPESRLRALNELLPRLIAAIGEAGYREAVQILFALAPGTRAANLTARRRQAAEVLGYSLSHFREAKESGLLEAVARLVHDDLLRYQSRVKRASESLEPTGDTPLLGPDHLTHEEELVSRIWQHVYGLRAELIAAIRLNDADGFEAHAEDHRQAAFRQHHDLQVLLKEYVDTYGERLIRHGEAEYGVEALERLAGWQA